MNLVVALELGIEGRHSSWPSPVGVAGCFAFPLAYSGDMHYYSAGLVDPAASDPAGSDDMRQG